jgi:hypothetical protein
MRQTAVQWLENELQEYFFHGNGTLETIWKQAKEMEKKQIIDARVDGDTWSTAIKEMRTEYAEQYYNETFNTKER